jgi:hypothetical protein
MAYQLHCIDNQWALALALTLALALALGMCVPKGVFIVKVFFRYIVHVFALVGCWELVATRVDIRNSFIDRKYVIKMLKL